VTVIPLVNNSSGNVFLNLQIVDNLTVVNDHAERAVKLTQDFNQILTQDEKAYQNVLLTVADHWKTMPN